MGLKCGATWSVVASEEHAVGEREEEINHPMLPTLIVEPGGTTQCPKDKQAQGRERFSIARMSRDDGITFHPTCCQCSAHHYSHVHP